MLLLVTEMIHVLDHDPDLAEFLDGERLEKAVEECVAPAVSFKGSEWSPMGQLDNTRAALGMLLLRGIVMRRVGMAGRFGSEILGEGDILRPWQDEDMGALGLRTGRWKVLRSGQMALLDSDFAFRVAAYPEVMACLLARAVRRSRYLAMAMAIVHQPRIDVRLHMLLWQLAARWGQMHRDGVHLPVRLTHSTLADLVAARRPTVTKALGELSERSLVIWTGEHWLLPESPPAELEAPGSAVEAAAARS
jgi:hypothetical protein